MVCKLADITARASLGIAEWLIDRATVTRHARVADLSARAAVRFIGVARHVDGAAS